MEHACDKASTDVIPEWVMENGYPAYAMEDCPRATRASSHSRKGRCFLDRARLQG